MRKLYVVVFIAVLASSSVLSAQQTIRRFEAGVQSTFLETGHQPMLDGDFSDGSPTPASQWGIGPALLVNLNKSFAIDSTFTFVPQRLWPAGILEGGRTIEGQAGIRASVHTSRVTFFAKVRPGFISSSQAARGLTVTSGEVLPVYARQTDFMLDLGGGVEYAMTPRLSVRGDLGANIVRWGASSLVQN